VTDSREAPFKRPAAIQRQSTRLISVDNVLQYASEIPSGQRRGPPRPVVATRTESGRHPLNPKLGGGAGRTVQSHIPQRSSKVSEKLVLLPEADIEDEDQEKSEFDEDNGTAPPRDDFELRRRKPTGLKEKSYAERLPKASRTERLSRVTAYCTAQSYRMKATAAFVREKHGAKTKLYDDCLYTVYHLPLVSGTEGFRIRSSPVLKSPGGKALLDEEIERNERQDYSEGYFGGDDYRVQYNADSEDARRDDDHDHSEDETHGREAGNGEDREPDEDRGREPEGQVQADRGDEARRPGQDSTSSELNHHRSPSPQQNPHDDDSSTASSFAEMFIFSYGVVVFWNFTERQEKDILADLAFSSSHGALPLALRPQLEEDFETEQFHFEYNHAIPRPRVFNDMITLRSRDHMIKLSMSHAIAQSTKLSFFEERMAETMEEAQYVPRRLALRGELGMKREEVVRILGRLFMSRVDVNLCESSLVVAAWRSDFAQHCRADLFLLRPKASNMLDVPNFFWESEPTLHPLYSAVREYLEIKPRIQVLNERCRVFLDLAEILSDSIADRKMSRTSFPLPSRPIPSILSEFGERSVVLARDMRNFWLTARARGKQDSRGSSSSSSSCPSSLPPRRCFCALVSCPRARDAAAAASRPRTCMRRCATSSRR